MDNYHGNIIVISNNKHEATVYFIFLQYYFNSSGFGSNVSTTWLYGLQNRILQPVQDLTLS